MFVFITFIVSSNPFIYVGNNDFSFFYKILILLHHWILHERKSEPLRLKDLVKFNPTHVTVKDYWIPRSKLITWLCNWDAIIQRENLSLHFLNFLQNIILVRQLFFIQCSVLEISIVIQKLINKKFVNYPLIQVCHLHLNGYFCPACWLKRLW